MNNAYGPSNNYGANMLRNNSNYGQDNYWQTSPYTYQPQVQPNTNVILVTGLEEALIKTNMRNSDMVYFDQDRSVFYRVKVDIEGKKSWAEFPYNIPGQEDNSPVTKAEFQQLLARIEVLENSKVATRKKKEVVDNVESDG